MRLRLVPKDINNYFYLFSLIVCNLYVERKNALIGTSRSRPRRRPQIVRLPIAKNPEEVPKLL